jgi:hypothetical protein
MTLQMGKLCFRHGKIAFFGSLCHSTMSTYAACYADRFTCTASASASAAAATAAVANGRRTEQTAADT